MTGCATTVPYTGVGPYPQIERGHPVPPIDVLGNVLALPAKLLLWSWKFDLHYISPATEEKLVEYLEARHLPALKETKFQLNEYNPGQDFSRLIHNHYVAWPYRVLIGGPTTIILDILLPGRLFPWGDYYNPYTNTVHLYSDHPAIVLHEAGHAYDFATQRYKGTYSAIRLIPFVDLYQEYQATKEAISYLKETKDHLTEVSAYKILYPAYGTYVGSYLFPPIGTLGGALLGHLTGRSTAAVVEHHYRHHPEADLTPAHSGTLSQAQKAPAPSPTAAPAEPSTTTPEQETPNTSP